MHYPLNFELNFRLSDLETFRLLVFSFWSLVFGGCRKIDLQAADFRLLIHQTSDF